jgi:hypothetical protein
MFERKIEEITSLFSRITIGEQDSITARQIYAAAIPQSLKLFFDRDVEVWVSEEKQRLLNSSHFHYSDDEIIGKFDSIVALLPQYARFTALEYQHTLDRNVSLLFNYVCRPQWSLLRYFFSDRQHVPTAEIVQGLKHFWHYEYYRLVLTEYFSKKDIPVIDARKFEDLVKNIDNEITRSFDSKKLASLTEPIFELFNVDNESETPLVPTDALSIFFDDKGLSSIVESIDREKSRREFVSMHDLVILIGEVDFTMSLDISSIVNQHARSLGVQVPERLAHAGRDFDVPSIPAIEQDPVDISDGERHLDFVISEEEQGVIERDFDSVISEDDDVDSLYHPSPYDEIDNMKEQATIEENSETIGTIVEDPLDMDELAAEAELPEYSASEESLLDLEKELYIETEQELPEDSEDTEVLENDEVLSEEAEIYNMKDLDEVAAIGLLDEEGDSMTSTLLVNDDIEMDISLDDEDELILDIENTKDTAELDIDWEKEAANIPDMALGENTQESTVADTATAEDIRLETEKHLKPAEELLSQLQLDDVDEILEKPDQKRFSDIPLIDDDDFPRRGATNVDKEADEIPIPADDVIRRFGDLLQQISVSDQKKYAKKLFRKNEDTVKHALSMLNGKPTWREASEYIDELFIKYDVDMYSRIAVQFTDDIYKRYLPRK